MSNGPGGPVPGGGDAGQARGAPPPGAAARGWPQQGWPEQGGTQQGGPHQEWAHSGSGGSQQGWAAQQMSQAGQWQPSPQGSYLPQAQGQAGSNGMAVASLILGITSIVFCWWGLFTLAQVVLAIVFGIKGMHRADAGAGGKGLALAGFVCGCVGGALYLVAGIFTLGVGFFI